MGRPGGVLGASWGLPEAPGGILRRKGRIVESCSRSCTINVVSSRVPHGVPSKYQLSLIASMPPTGTSHVPLHLHASNGTKQVPREAYRLGCRSESSGVLLGVPSERSLEPLSGSFAASWEHLVCVLGVPWRPLEPFWRPLGDLLGPPGASVGSLGASCGPLGAEGSKWPFGSPVWAPLEPSWGPPGPSWRPLGPAGRPLGPFSGPLGGLWGHRISQGS